MDKRQIQTGANKLTRETLQWVAGFMVFGIFGVMGVNVAYKNNMEQQAERVNWILERHTDRVKRLFEKYEISEEEQIKYGSSVNIQNSRGEK